MLPRFAARVCVCACVLLFVVRIYLWRSKVERKGMGKEKVKKKKRKSTRHLHAHCTANRPHTKMPSEASEIRARPPLPNGGDSDRYNGEEGRGFEKGESHR